jgi:23S rRNA (uracil1939-C5)-methyltransferase
VCTACGGCQFQQLDYPSELEFKTKQVQEALTRIGHLNVKINPTIGMDDPYYYRNKIQMPLGLDKKKRIISGFYKQRSHEIVPIEECVIEDKRSVKVLKVVKELMASFNIEPYDEDKRSGIIRHILIKTSKYSGEIMLVLVTNIENFPSKNNFVKAIIEHCPEISTIVQNVNTRDTNIILGDREKVLYGKGYISDTLCGIKFKISAKSFYQVNPVMTEILYRKAMELAKLKKSDVVLDAYSGVGTIGLIAAKDVKEVISVEIVKEACLDAISNARLNDYHNFKVMNRDASRYAQELAVDKAKIDILFMDPPRKGSDEAFLSSVLLLKPERIIYVSCEPSTLARDLAYLSKEYIIQEVQPVDLFPRTYHVEIVVNLIHKSRDK